MKQYKFIAGYVALQLAFVLPATAQSSVVGQWGTTQPFPFITVHTALMPNGQVIVWDYSGNTRLWNPVTAAFTTPAQPGRNTFCSGLSHLADGKLFVPGGHIQNNVGLNTASYFDVFANTWTSVPNMNAGRWYPSSTTLANGDVLVTSGDDNMAVNDLPQVYQVSNNSWRSLTSARMGLPLYPRVFLAPNGRAFFATSVSRYLDTAGSGSWTTVGNTIRGGRDNYGSAVIDHAGKVYWFGGEDPPTATCERIDLTAGTPAWTSIASMPQARRQNNATILPDGRILVTGGSSASGFNTEDGPKPAIVYDPVANTWTTWATESDYRGYHSTAVLLPDGRVLSSGGDNHANGQVFSPPYLFNGTRPAISSAPSAVNYGDVFFVGTPDGATITKVTLTRLGSITHAQNWNQRYVVLSFSQTGGGLNVTAPNSVNHCPPGHYLLWILNGSGVPSEGRFLRISDFAAPPPAPTGLTASPGIAKVTLDWAVTPNATSYNVKRSTTSGGPYSTIATGVPSNSYVDTNVVGGTTYYYVVSAVNPRGESPNSAQASAAPLQGGGGTGLKGDYYNNMTLTAPITLMRTDATINFDWGNGSPDPALPVDRFSIRWTGQVQPLYSQTYTFYTETDDGVRLWVNNVLVVDKWIDQAPTEWSGTIALTGQQRYDIRMEFYENGGGAVARLRWSSPSQAKEIIPQSQLFPPQAAPPAPANLTAVGRNARVDLSWGSSAGATSYNVKRSTTSGGPYSTIASSVTGTTHSDTTAVNGTTYHYVVTAVNSGGESPNSNQASATPQPPPPAPTNLTATPGNGQVVLNWNASAGATSYNVSRSTTSGGPYSGVAFNLGVTTFTDNTVNNGTTYYYVVTAVNDSGESPNSNQASATPTAPNAPPVINSFTSSPNPAPINTSVSFTASATDPDGDSLSYSFDFGDGTPPTAFSANSSAAHSYSVPGRYSATVRVRDALHTNTASRVQIIHRPLTAGSPKASAQILYDASRHKVWNVNPDSDTVTRIDATALSKDFEIAVGTEPRTLALRPDNSEIWVTSEGSDQIHVLSASSGAVLQVLSTPRGSRPMGIAFSPDGAAAYVTYMDSGLLAKWNPSTRTVVATLDVGSSPRALAISADSARVFVGRFISPASVGEVREVSASTFTITRTLTLAHDTTPDTEASGRGTPNYLLQMSISPDGQRLWVPSKKDNTDRGQFRDGFPLTHDSTVRSIFSLLDLVNNLEDAAARRDVDDHELPHGVSFSPVGDLAFIAYQGNNEVRVFNAYNSGNIAAISLGTQLAPQDLVLNPAGTRLFVMNFMSRTVSAFDVAGLVNGTSSTATQLAVINAVATEKLSAQVLQGKKIFYNAADPRMSLQGYISCAACHLDGGQDGRVWDFTDRGEGFRNTIKLQGKRGTAQGNVHWTANFDEIQDFELDIRNEFGGTGFISGTPNASLGAPNAGRSADLDALAAYVTSLAGVGRSPHRNSDGTLTADGVAGRQLFQQLNCASCHSGEEFADSTLGTANIVLHNVGTIKSSSGQRMGQALTGLDTPTLRGIWNTGPYLHDGSAATLLDVITTQNSGDQHGVTSTLTPAQQSQLVAYLRQIDDTEPAAIPVAPTALTATPGNGQVSLTWGRVLGAATYNVKRSTTGGGPYSTVASSVTGTNHTDTGLANGTTYYYVVSAVNTGGEGFNSSEASATPFVSSTTVTFTSVGAEDGYVRESSETSNTGSTTSATSTGTSGLRAGDDNSDRQYKAFVSFDTASIPDGATIISATLRLKRGTVSGTNPFTTHGACYVDIQGSTGFGGSVSLASGDFQAAASATQVATMSDAPSNGAWSTGNINTGALSFINKTGKTQFRIYFASDDNDDNGNDYIGWYPGENGTSANRPVLEVVYQ